MLLEARDCSRECLSEDYKQRDQSSLKVPWLGLPFPFFGEHLQFAGRFTISVQAKGYQRFFILFLFFDANNDVSACTACSGDFPKTLL
ncbi:hypothetical protein [Comamonas sp. lk]|uniref:hypothetical protein n=2 Tax=unclassified Comamonas TaxID=2638500 RepID=UPI0013CF321E|nr:hypothetical protein [Comamonas sp. lk]